MAAWLDACRFTATAGGTSDWTYSSAVTGYNSPANAAVVNATVYKFRAESTDLSQWEECEGAYSSSGAGSLARTTVLYNSSGTGTKQSGAGTKINFSAAPQVAVVASKHDLISIEEANAFTAAQQAQARTNISAALKGQISGLTLSNNGSDAVNDIDIATGEAASTETNPVLMVLSSALTKRLDAAWAVGTNQGGLDTGSIADHDGTSTTSLAIGTGSKTFTTQSGKAFLAGEWVYAFSAGSPSNAMFGVVSSYSGTTLALTVYQTAGSGTFTDWTLQQETTIHCWLIQRSDTGVVDHLFSLSASSPTMPSNYDRKRLHMSFIRTQGTIKAFKQYGDLVKYAVARYPWNLAAAQSDIALRMAVPSGINLVPLLDGVLQQNAAGSGIILVNDGDSASADYAICRTGNASEWSIIHSENFVTNTAGQLRFSVLNSSGSLNSAQLKNHGYIHGRGR